MKTKILIILSFFLWACGSATQEEQNTAEKPADENAAFDTFKNTFVDSLWIMNPIWASYQGMHDYDDQLPIPSAEADQKQLRFAESQLAQLNAFNLNALKKGNKTDFYMIRDYLQAQEFFINEFRSWEWNPATYNLGGAFFQVLNYREQSLDKRLQNIEVKLEQVPAYYQAARGRIKQPTQVHTELAIQQLKGSRSVFEQNILDSLAKSGIEDASKQQIESKALAAVKAINAYLTFLQEEVMPSIASEGRSFRIGKEMFERKFVYDIQSAYTAEEVFEAAVETKTDLHDKMYRLSEMLWEKYYGEAEKPGSRLEQIRMVIEAVSKKHVSREEYIPAIRQQIAELEAFVMENDLLSLDPEKPLVVRETPAYQRGFSIASIESPGPYDKNAETYYNVSPLDDYTEAEAESHLREYNHYILQILNIHEAVPGHYTQLVYANQSPSLIKSILGNGAMIEGWAVYTELMMLEAGYGGDAIEMGLMYYKWNLRTVCNTILDFGIHVNGFTEDDAMHLLMKEAFQEEAEARGKWRRARLSQVQLCSYFTGFYEIKQFRDELQYAMGADFKLKAFHEQFLSYGSAPVKYIRELMLEDWEINLEPEIAIEGDSLAS